MEVWSSWRKRDVSRTIVTRPSRPGRLMEVTACQDLHETPRTPTSDGRNGRAQPPPLLPFGRLFPQALCHRARRGGDLVEVGGVFAVLGHVGDEGAGDQLEGELLG